MSELHRAVQDEIASFSPLVVPPFETITARRRARDRRRLATGGAALSAVAVLAVAAAPSLAGAGGDRLTADRPPASYAAPTGNGLAWTGATICLTADACRTLDAEQAQELDAVLDTAVPPPPDLVYCLALGPSYTIRFEHPTARTVPITVRTPCGPMEQGDAQYLLDPTGQDQVEQAYRAARETPSTGVVEPVTQDAFVAACVGAERVDLVPELIGLTEDEVMNAPGADSDRRVVGRDGQCLGRTRDYQADRVNLIISDNEVVWAGRF